MNVPREAVMLGKPGRSTTDSRASSDHPPTQSHKSGIGGLAKAKVRLQYRAAHAVGLFSLIVVLVIVPCAIAISAMNDGYITAGCVQSVGKTYVGVHTICSMVGTARSGISTVLLISGLCLGGLTIVIAATTYRQSPTREVKRKIASGTVLGIEAVLLALGFLEFRRGNILVFVKQFLDFPVIRGNWSAFLLGMRNTLEIAIGGAVGGLVIGVILALAIQSQLRPIRIPGWIYVNFFRGTPMIWQLSFFYFGLSLGLGIRASTIEIAIIVFAMSAGAYAAEVFRAGLESLERGQMEAARGLGLSHMQAMIRVILPQAVRRGIPPLMNIFVMLIKESSLISELDLYNWALQSYANSFNASYFLFAAFGYLIVTLPLIYLVGRLERRIRSGLLGYRLG
jgi:glutamine transport system permease protein